MNVGVIGAGYVGLVTGACLADFGHTVTCVDADADRIEGLCRGALPFHEPGASELVHHNVAAGRLRFSHRLKDGVAGTRVIILAVGTPDDGAGSPDLTQLDRAIVEVARELDGYHVIAIKSTVPVGTNRRVSELVRAHLLQPARVDVVSNPEFLREGSAVGDFMRPDRVVIGSNSAQASAIMRDLYRPLYLIDTPVVCTDPETAELIKYACNAFLATKISFVNEIANLCDEVGVDVHVVAKAMGLDKRIGPKFLHAGPGFGGSCFPKDTRALATLGRRYGVPLRIVESAIAVNIAQGEAVVAKVAAAVAGLAGRTIAVLGLAFKPNTSDVRESPAIHLCIRLVEEGAIVRAFDPVACASAAAVIEADAVTYAESAYEAADGADAVVIMTEWNEFRSLDLHRLQGVMRDAVIVDVRNVLDPARVRSLGFTYVATGRRAPLVAVERAAR
ncbi:MAG: UDP-glucose/GDP-mannose dehydrogenase family protein [Acidobacteria bacterium]|nr:UDP-glucose/GDP-mannose dehydrogenase family protein [Acidobacteriota bacterium]